MKPLWRLVTATDAYYHFVNSRSTGGEAYEFYNIARSDFWGERSSKSLQLCLDTLHSARLG